MTKWFMLLLVTTILPFSLLAQKQKTAPVKAGSLEFQLEDPEGVYKLLPKGAGLYDVVYAWPADATVYELHIKKGKTYYPHHKMATLKFNKATIDGKKTSRSKGDIRIGVTALITQVNLKFGEVIHPGQVMFTIQYTLFMHDSKKSGGEKIGLGSMSDMLADLGKSTGIYDLYKQTKNGNFSLGLGRIIMMCVGLLLLYLAIFKGFEPLLLVPIGFGAIMTNIPVANLAAPSEVLGMIYITGVKSGMFPLLIFMGVGAMTDFGPLIANPKTALLGAAAQLGIFGALVGALVLGAYVPGINFGLKEAASIGIIGGADGPTAIYVASRLSPNLLGSIAVAAYSYMALVPIILPPIIKFFTTEEQRKIRMVQLRPVSKLEKICFPLLITLLCAFLLPSAAPLISMLMFGNLMKECGVVERLADTAANSLINIVTICLGLAVGSKLSADKFLNAETLGILILGLIAFAIGTSGGVLLGQLMRKLSGNKVNPMIGAAGVSAVPMAARVVNKLGMEEDHHNFLLMHAMGPNVAGVIGSAVAAGVLLSALYK